ncbi:ABC transporter ATP-binding protein [Spirochaetota bacterium]|nr:ABC transporter ATP-binding protein [Spirochaetota bacterium]
MQPERDFSEKPFLADRSLIKKLIAYLKRFPALLTASLILLIISDLINASYPLFLKNGIDNNITAGDLPGLYKTTLFLALTLLAGFLFSTTFQILTNYLGQKVIFAIRTDVLTKITQLTNRYFDKTPTGRNLTYLTNDIEAVKEFISSGIISIIGDMLKCLFILAFMIAINWRLTLFALVGSLPIFIIATYLFRLKIRKGYRGVRTANSIMNTLLIESLTGIKEILLFNHRKKSITDFNSASSNYLKSFLNIIHAYSIYFPLIEIVTSGSMIGILFFAHYTLNDLVTIGELFTFFIYVNLFFRPLLHLAEQFNSMQAATAACERIFSFLATKVEFTSTVPYTPQKRFTGAIAFNNVSFHYEKNNPVLKNISFTIKPGQKVAIVGSTGSGKTTLISLLNRLYDVSAGSITIDNTDIRNYHLTHLRENIGTIPQNIFLFTGSFHENIALFRDIPRAAIKKAAAHALIDTVIEKNPSSYDQNVLEEGKALSTGQKQLLAFARIFIQNTPIVILDEATANIDSESERHIEQALDSLLTDKTAIIIAHRLATIARADKIIVLHHGRIIASGSHEHLLRSSPIYQKLYSLQQIQLTTSSS